MPMRKLLLLSWLLLCSLMVWAAQRSSEDALSIARSFFMQSSSIATRNAADVQLVAVSSDLLNSTSTRSVTNGNAFYIYNNAHSAYVIVSGDDRFTQSFFELIEKNISNPDLGIDLLSQELGLSRANLYRKLKAVTELSPTELIRNKRLEVAAKLLLETNYTVSEVAVYTGFNSHAYFTNCFKSFYGYSPSEWVQRHNNNKEGR